MASIVLNGDTSGSVTLSPPAVAGTNTATLPAATGTVMVSGNMPAFSAYLNAPASLSNGTYSKITLDSEVFDTNNNFASSRFTPTVAGYYQLNGQITFQGAVTSEVVFVLYKNGAAYHDFCDIVPSTTYGISGSALVYANGSTDYFELYVYQNSSRDAYGNGSPRLTWFNGSMVRSA